MARIEVPMPQMGESIAEGTVSKWLKQVGDTVERDEPILEISTDKVDAEIPSPAEGVLVEVLVEEGETVEVGTIVAYVDPEGEASESAKADEEDGTESGEEEEKEAAGSEGEGTEAEEGAEAESGPSEGKPEGEGVGEEEEAVAEDTGEERKGPEEAESEEERLRTRSTPVVRRIAEEHDVDLSQVEGSGHAGRVTKDDILAYLEAQDAEEGAEEAPPPSEDSEEPEGKETKKEPARPHAAPAEGRPAGVDASDLWKTFYSQVQHPEFPVRESDRVESMDKIRRLTAEHMVLAKRISPHVHSFIEIDFTRIDELRRANKERWAQQGARISFTAFVVWACSRVLREFPMVNGTISGNNLIYRGNVNIGVAVDLDPGLIVPVIRDADELSLVGIGKRIVDLAERARGRQLNPEDIQGATFSITNPGVLGTLAGTPIIPKGTNGILGTGAIEKRVVVVEDAETGADSIAIRKRAIFSLGYDHRMVDGADAARFLARLKEMMEDFPEDA